MHEMIVSLEVILKLSGRILTRPAKKKFRVVMRERNLVLKGKRKTTLVRVVNRIVRKMKNDLRDMKLVTKNVTGHGHVFLPNFPSFHSENNRHFPGQKRGNLVELEEMVWLEYLTRASLI